MRVKILVCDDWPELVGKIGEVWETYDLPGEFDLRVHVDGLMADNETWSFTNDEVELVD